MVQEVVNQSSMLHFTLPSTKTLFHFDMLLQLGASTRNVRWPKKSLIGIKNPYSDKASFFLVETSISTISCLQIAYPYSILMQKMVKFGTICLEKHQLMICSLENRYSDTYLRPFHSIWSGNLQPATNNYTMDLAFQQTKYWWLEFLHIGNIVVKFLPGPSIIKVYFTCINENLPNYLIYRISNMQEW